MKKPKKKKNFFVRTISLITDNWGLKLLSLVLAVLIYYSMKPNNGTLHKTKFERTNERSAFQQ